MNNVEFPTLPPGHFFRVVVRGGYVFLQIRKHTKPKKKWKFFGPTVPQSVKVSKGDGLCVATWRGTQRIREMLLWEANNQIRQLTPPLPTSSSFAGDYPPKKLSEVQ